MRVAFYIRRCSRPCPTNPKCALRSISFVSYLSCGETTFVRGSTVSFVVSVKVVGTYTTRHAGFSFDTKSCLSGYEVERRRSLMNRFSRVQLTCDCDEAAIMPCLTRRPTLECIGTALDSTNPSLTVRSGTPDHGSTLWSLPRHPRPQHLLIFANKSCRVPTPPP